MLTYLAIVLRCRAWFQYLALDHSAIYVDHMRLLQAKRTELRQSSLGEHVPQMTVREWKNNGLSLVSYQLLVA